MNFTDWILTRAFRFAPPADHPEPSVTIEKPANALHSALDLKATDSQGNLLRLFTDGLDAAENPTALFNAGAHFHTIASILVSGVPNGLDGDAWDVVEPAAGRYSYMLGVWADTAGPTVIFRSNEYSARGVMDAHPLMFMSGSGEVTLSVEDDGSLSWGAGNLREDHDVRLSRVGAGYLGIDTRSVDQFEPNEMNGKLALKTLGLSEGGGVDVSEEGTAARMGVTTLVAGEATVATSAVTADSRIMLTSQVDGGTPGYLRVSSRSPGVDFTITSGSSSDTSEVAWIIFEPFTPPEIALGSELVYNPTFDSNIDGWSSYPSLEPTTLEWSAGELHAVNDGSNRGLFGLTPGTHKFPVESGKQYRVQGTVRCVSGKTCSIGVVQADYGAPVFLMIDNNQNPATYTFDEVMTSAYTGNVHFQGDFQSLVGDCYIDNLSVKEVL